MKFLNKVFFSRLIFFKKIQLILSKKEKTKGLFFVVLMFLGMMLETLGIGLIAPVIQVMSDSEILETDNYMTGIIKFLGISNYDSLIITFTVGLVLIYLIKNLFLMYFSWFKINYLAALRMNLSNRLFNIYLSKPYAFHLDRNSGQLIQNISLEVTIFTGRCLNSIVIIFTESLVLMGIIALLFYLEPYGALIVVTALGIITKLILSFTKKMIKDWAKQRQFHDGKKIQHLQQGLAGVKDVLLLGREDYFLNQFKLHNLQSNLPERKQSFLEDIPRLWFEVLAVLGMTSMILIMTLQGKEITTILAILGVFAAASFRLMPSITRILAAIQAFRFSLPVLDTLHHEFDSELQENKRSNGNKLFNLSKLSKEIEISNITFAYKDSLEPSLSNVNLKIKRGQSIGIIGPSGSGKSTLVDILLGLLKPNVGHIYVDKEDIYGDIRSWQDQVGYVPQSIYLIDSSLRKNIAFGIAEDEIDESRIEYAIHAAHLTDFVNNLPDGLDTYVGERGVRLSGGQRQRIGIARALYPDPSIIVLDEASSSLDNATEKQIMHTVEQLHLQKTIIIIAHRLSTIENCDWIFKLDRGKIIDEGKPDQLLNKSYQT
jgi:ABC-type multidrug transport system fused ATPase/permease subunit